MPALTTIPLNRVWRTRPGSPRPQQRSRRRHPINTSPARFAIPDRTPADVDRRPFAPLIDAKAASQLLGVPHTWLLTQAREGRIPHHRLGHYVRFNPNDLQDWLNETRSTPHDGRFQARRRQL